jgi:D-amino peptidase
VNVYLSVDMEGLAGVNHPGPTDRKHDRYPAAVELMIGETNAAIEGALAGGATDVLVNDSHGEMYNLLPDRIHPGARLLQGHKPWSMVAGAGPDAGFDVALFVGYHARAGHPTGTIAHTYSGAPVETRLDGRPTGEYGLNAIALAVWSVPVGIVAGDDALAAEVEGWLPWAERVVVKTATGGRSAASIHPSRAAELVRAGAERAIRRAAAGELELLRVGPPVSIEVDYARGVQADFAAIVPGAERFGDRSVRFVSDDPITAYRCFHAGNRLASGIDLARQQPVRPYCRDVLAANRPTTAPRAPV